ncbi:MAG TPA: IS30 family transposase [Polyangia bacterium]|jgi:IS30 family transposase|nr:IS30 family transposase [Polyangia bacterium]
MPRRSPALNRAAAAGKRGKGRPPAGRREHVVRFWEAIARGASSERAAVEAGVLPSIGVRWFRKGGGMPPLDLAPVSGRYLSFTEREEIAVGLARGCGVRGIARQLGRAPSTISRELQRNAALRTGRPEYRASTAQTHADRRARRPKPAKLAVNPELRRYVQDRLAGEVQRPDGSVAGPLVGWRGRRQGPRKDRRWGLCWSPEQISCRLRVDFPDDESMRVSHEAIYQSLYIQGRGALRRELTACLRTGRALRAPSNRTSKGNRSFVTDELLISERPAEVDDRAVPGHWEGDLILGVDRSAIGTLVERSSRFTMLLHLPPIEGHDSSGTKGSRVSTGAGAGAVRDAIADTITTLPEQLRRSLTWDQGIEMAQHVQLRLDTGLQIYFCDPRSPWQRATNENTNGLLRQYFPRGTDLARHSAEELSAVAAALNGRPRKTLGWRTPAEALAEYLTAAA